MHNQEVEDLKSELRHKHFHLSNTIGISFFLVICLIISIVHNYTLKERFNEINIKYNQVIAQNFSVGVSGNITIKAINYEYQGSDNKVTKEKIINNVQWAKLEPWPTIGSNLTLLYIDGNNKINRIPVDDVKIQ